MATKIQRIRRIGRIVIGAVKGIFRTGRAWGTARTRAAQVRRPAPKAYIGIAAAVGAAGAVAGAYLFDPQEGKRRRHVAFDRLMALLRRGKAKGERKAQYAAGVAKGAAAEATGAGEGAEWLPDPDLVNKVRTEAFRGEDAPKGDVNVNAENGVVYLRGAVDSPAARERLETSARRVKGGEGGGRREPLGAAPIRQPADLRHASGTHTIRACQSRSIQRRVTRVGGRRRRIRWRMPSSPPTAIGISPPS